MDGLKMRVDLKLVVVNILKDKLSLEDRMIKNYLSELSKLNKIKNITYGNYTSINYKMKENDEERKQ